MRQIQFRIYVQNSAGHSIYIEYIHEYQVWFFYKSVIKGQLISEAIFLVLNSSKKRTQYLKNFVLAKGQ